MMWPILPEFSDLPGLIEAVLKAGQVILGIDHGRMGVQWKEDASPLTEADLKSHEVLWTYLKIHSEHPVISEEGQDHFLPEQHAGPFWLVDPLDGTREFLDQNGEYTVNVALVCQGYPILGVIFAPHWDECYVGVVGQGAWFFKGSEFLSSEAKQPALIQTRYPQDPYDVLVSRRHNKHGFLKKPAWAHMPHRTQPCGSSLKFCRIAAGLADVYLRMGPTGPWDTAAGQAIVESAGGVVLDLKGKRFIYNQIHLKNPPFVALGHLAAWPLIEAHL